MVPCLQEDFDETKYKVLKYIYIYILIKKIKLIFKVIIKKLQRYKKCHNEICILQKPPCHIVSPSIYSKLV